MAATPLAQPAPGPQPARSAADIAQFWRVARTVAGQRWRQRVRYPMSFVTNGVFQSISWLAPLYFLGRAFAPNGHAAGLAAYTGSGDYMTFLLLGAFVGGFVNSVFWGMGFALKEQMDEGMLEANWLTPSSRFAQLVGISLFDLTYTMVETGVVLVLAAWLFGFHPNGAWLPALGFLVPVLVGLYGFGFAFAGLILLVRQANELIDMTSFAVGLLSGQSFPVQVLPTLLLGVALVLPSTYAIDGMRGLLLGTRTLLPIGWEWAVLSALALALVVAGRWVFLRLERFCRQRGTLALH